MDTRIILTIEAISAQSIRVSIGGDNVRSLQKKYIVYNEDELEVGAEIEIIMSEDYATDKELV